jgi:PAS domain S-box-containing protein
MAPEMRDSDRRTRQGDERHPAQPHPDPNATGATDALPGAQPGEPGRETHERNAALARAQRRAAEPSDMLCAPDLSGLRAELLFTLLAENVREYAVFLMDVNGIIRCWGEGARLMKWWTRPQAEGSHLRLLYPDGGAEDGTAESHLDQADKGGEYSGEGHRIRNDGSTFWAGVTLTALRDTEGTLVGFAKVTRDFSARRSAEAALRSQVDVAEEATRAAEEANRLKSLFIASVSHDVRTPLTAMLGYIELLARETAGAERQQAHVAKLKQTSQHLMGIMQDLLDMSRLEAGSLPIEPAKGRLGPAIEHALADVEHQVAARGVTLHNAVSGAVAELPYWGDAERVRQIVVNLLTNAVKFTERGGHITISGGTGDRVAAAALHGSGPWVYVRVEDTGRGISPERLEAIFEPYQQSAAGDAQQGTGLGLSIGRRLARLMRGEITVTSQVGAGSSFTLWLPIAPAAPVPR